MAAGPVDGTGVTIPASGAPTPGVFQHTFDPWGIRCSTR